ncbi:MBL fold metallo-hydrolase [Geothrix limicola]|uniref:MBL fold metallo-hydrolase n=1 Tax=Geothrix limicola TaxID=2927978 RepID=A0ABQ5Q9W4_9BACT|nr:MBL fold metallo-hydrolase [Geothrix limicola]GLH71620.1 MBL fold metallo-hydrolase [Geothrix limicola]
MAPTRILRIPILPFGMVNCHLVHSPDGCVLVDAGIPGSEAKIGRALRQLGLTFRDIKLIVVTHAHMDHAGSAAAVREASGAPILGHEGDLAHYRREAPMTFCATGLAGRFLLKRGIIQQPYAAFEPDLLLTGDETLDLHAYGIAGRVVPTLGHTKGSISVELATREALVGDLLASGIFMGGILRTGHAIRPPFEDDPQAVGRELQRLVASGVTRFHLGHGGPLDGAEVQRHARRLMKHPPVR